MFLFVLMVGFEPLQLPILMTCAFQKNITTIKLSKIQSIEAKRKVN